MTKFFITTTKGGSGYFAVLMWLNEEEPDIGPFWEPYSTGYGRYITRNLAVAEAKHWAEVCGYEYIE